MPIGTPTVIGSGSDGSSPFTITTTGSAPSGSDTLIIVVATWGASADVTGTMSGGSLTWTTDQSTLYDPGFYKYRIGIMSAPAPSGLASSTTLTCTLSGASDGVLMTAVYCTGLDTSSGRFDVGSGTGAATANWTTNSATTSNANDLIIGGSWLDGTSSSTATTGTELTDFQFAANAWTHTATYNIVSSAGSQSLTGTWLASSSEVSAFAAYKAAAGAAAVDAIEPRDDFEPVRFGPF